MLTLNIKFCAERRLSTESARVEVEGWWLSRYDCKDDDDDEGGGATRGRKRRWTNTDDDDDGEDHHRHSTFVSHNTPLLTPAACGDDAHATLSDAMRRSRSLLEQAAFLISRWHLICRFPEIVNATSVEVWRHQRPRDHGSHRLHYDMDEVALLERRRKIAGGGGSSDRPRTHTRNDELYLTHVTLEMIWQG